MMTENGGSDFVFQLRQRGIQKASEYKEAQHQIEYYEMVRERAKNYVEDINKFLEHEGQPPILLTEPRPGNIVKRAGNRAKDMPIRKAEWEGQTINEIVTKILNSSPNEAYHVDQIATMIYEIQSKMDLRRVKRNIVSMLRKGAKDGLWEKAGRGKFKAKIPAEQTRLVNV